MGNDIFRPSANESADSRLAQDIALRDKLRQEMRDSIEHRKGMLRQFIAAHGAHLSGEERSYLLLRNRDFRGDLFDIIEKFIRLDPEQQLRALDEASFEGLPWSPIIQSHPYLYLRRWREFFGLPDKGSRHVEPCRH